MASRGQSVTVTYVAWDINLNTPKTGDVANHTLRWVKDGTASATTNSASEIDATNAPGVYKITLTGTETTCDVGTLAGKSSTANVVVIPLTISFEMLPTNALGTNGAISTQDANGAVSANLVRINGSLTNGNNATLSLASLNIQNSGGTAVVMRSTGASGNGLEVTGHNTGSGMVLQGGTTTLSGDGGHGIKSIGGNAVYGSIAGDGLYFKGGFGSTAGNGMSGIGGSGLDGYGLYLEGQYAEGLYVISNNSDGAYITGRTGLTLAGTNYSGLDVRSLGSDAIAISTFNPGSVSVNAKNGTIGFAISRPKKNTALSNFMFPMFNATTKAPQSGLTVTAQRAIDGNPFSACANAVAEISNGTYRINLSASDMNGEKIMFRFTATGADDQLIEILTQD